jgi:hypothetical protein
VSQTGKGEGAHGVQTYWGARGRCTQSFGLEAAAQRWFGPRRGSEGVALTQVVE